MLRLERNQPRSALRLQFVVLIGDFRWGCLISGMMSSPIVGHRVAQELSRIQAQFGGWLLVSQSRGKWRGGYPEFLCFRLLRLLG